MSRIDMETITHEAFVGINELDKGFVGTSNYLGVAYFWSIEYKHYLRDTTVARRRRVHREFLAAGLALDGLSDAHLEIVLRVTGDRGSQG